MGRLPNFVIIGAMKSATSTLYEQLQRQPGIFLPELKEPNFFSDQYARGWDWYAGLFAEARASDIVGEASTHYTKLPTYPETVSRMWDHLPDAHLIYVMRDPIDRLVSQYIHQWSEGEIHCGLNEAVALHPELLAYSCYARQLRPYIEAFGKDAILPVFFDRLIQDPQGELERVCSFIGYCGRVHWDVDLSRRNVSDQRVRRFPLYDLLVENALATKLRRAFVPKELRTKVRQFFSMRKRPVLNDTTRKRLENELDRDLAILSRWLGCELDCRSFRAVTRAAPLVWH